MAVWEKEHVVVFLANSNTGAWDMSAHEVEFQPVSREYPDGAVSGQRLTMGYAYRPTEDLDTTEAYDVYVDGVRRYRVWGPDLLPAVGEQEEV